MKYRTTLSLITYFSQYMFNVPFEWQSGHEHWQAKPHIYMLVLTKVWIMCERIRQEWIIDKGILHPTMTAVKLFILIHLLTQIMLVWDHSKHRGQFGPFQILGGGAPFKLNGYFKKYINWSVVHTQHNNWLIILLIQRGTWRRHDSAGLKRLMQRRWRWR